MNFNFSHLIEKSLEYGGFIVFLPCAHALVIGAVYCIAPFFESPKPPKPPKREKDLEDLLYELHDYRKRLKKIETAATKHKAALSDVKACRKFVDLSIYRDRTKYESKYWNACGKFNKYRRAFGILVRRIHKRGYGAINYGLTEQMARIKNLIHAQGLLLQRLELPEYLPWFCVPLMFVLATYFVIVHWKTARYLLLFLFLSYICIPVFVCLYIVVAVWYELTPRVWISSWWPNLRKKLNDNIHRWYSLVISLFTTK